MATKQPNPASAREQADGSGKNVSNPAKTATDHAQSGHRHGEKNTEQTLRHPGRDDEPKVE